MRQWKLIALFKRRNSVFFSADLSEITLEVKDIIPTQFQATIYTCLVLSRFHDTTRDLHAYVYKRCYAPVTTCLSLASRSANQRCKDYIQHHSTEHE